MYDQVNQQLLALTKQAAETFIKANAIAVDSFEKLVDIQIKTAEERIKATAELFGQASEVRDLDAAKNVWPKSVSLAKDFAEKLYAVGQEVAGVIVKTSEALGQLYKGSFEAANDAVAKPTVAKAK